MIRGLAHVCIGALDLAATERFYCDVLGMSKAFEFLRDDKVYGFYLKAGSATFLEVFLREKVVPQDTAPISHFCLEVTDIDAIVERLKANGYATTEKKTGKDQSLQVWTTDPAGVRIEFHQYTPKSSQFTGEPCIQK